MKRLGILGAAEFGRLVLDLALDCGYSDFVFFDDSASLPDWPTVGGMGDVTAFVRDNPGTELAMAIGYKHFAARRALYTELREVAAFPTLVHPTAYVSPRCRMGQGCLVYSMCNVEAGARVGDLVTVFNNSSITHDVIVGDNCFFSVGVALAGRVTFGDSCFVGVNATVTNDVQVGARSTVCAGTLLTKSIGEGTTVVGNPYKIIRGVKL